MKKVIAIMLATIVALSLAGCINSAPSEGTTTNTEAERTTRPSQSSTTTTEISSPNTTETTPASTTETTLPSTTESTPASTTESSPANATEPSSGGTDEPGAIHVPSGELSDDWTSFEAELNGIVYQLPALFSEFSADGWTLKEESETLAPNYHTTVQLKKGDQIVGATVLNLTGNVLPFGECYIEKLMLDSYDARHGAKLILPSGVTNDESNMDDVRAAYGEPSDIYEGTSIIIWTYSEETYSEAKIQFDIDTMKVSKVEIGNAYPREPIAAPELSGEIPASVANYVTPSALGESWDSFTVKYADDLYALPAPVRVFADNGWKILDADVIVSARSAKVGFEMSKNNQTLRAQIYNYSDTVQPAENCFVFFVRSSSNGPSLPIELPGGITMDSSYDDIISAYGTPDETDESGSMFNYYTYGSFDQEVSISIFQETGEIGTIEVSYRPRNLDY
ncbi:MAG: hypothetical protein FWH55_12305 [Oscillospiraceae bacterium]|nr:hypothetical protein [Oscillospiraceae bacterium]